MSNNSVLKGELIEHGTDCYLHDPAKSINYFAKIRLEDGTTTERWSKNLEEVIKNSGVKTGDTIVLTELGKEPIQIGDRTFNKTLWDLQRYEPAQNFLNVIENDSERQQQKQTNIANTDKIKEGEQELNIPNQSNKNSDWDFELPENIKNNYIAITKNRYLLDQRTNYYDKDDKERVNIAFEDHNNSLHTSRQDEKTIYAMLDMAQAKNWTAIKIKGAEEFKQKAWLEASLRGIEIKGYTPTEKDLAELQAKQAQRTTNQMEMTAQKTPEIQQEQVGLHEYNYTDEEMTFSEQQSNDYGYTDKNLGIHEHQVFEEPNVEQLTIQNNRFNFEPMTAEDVGIGESEYLRQATHITDMETGEHYIIGNYDFESNGEVYSGVIAEYYVNDEALAERDDNALYGEERILYKLGINNQSLISHIDGDNKLTNEQLDKFLSLETLKDIVSNNQPIMPTTEFQVVSDVAKQAEFDNRELALAQTAMLNNYTVAWGKLDQHEKYERLASSVGEYKIDEQKYNQFIDNLQRNINQDLSYLKYETKEIKQEPIPQKSAEDIKKDIRQIFQTGYKDGSIKSRDELVEVLKERGFEVKENDKSIRVSLPNSDQAVNLKGEVFTKGYDAIKSLKECLEPETLKQTYPTLKDSDIVHITAYKNKIFEDNKGGSPQILQASLVQLEDGIKSMAKGKEMNLPNLPINEIKPDIEVRTTENHDKSRQI